MPQDGLFFRVLRRFNMIWIAIAGILLIVTTGQLIYKNAIIRHELFGTKYSQFEMLPRGVPAKTQLRPETFGTPDTEYGPNLNTIMVLSRFGGLPLSPSAVDIRNFVPNRTINIMVLDEKTGDGHWLFPTNNQLIVTRDALYQGAATAFSTPASDARPVIGMVMAVAENDTAKDGKIVTSEPSALYVWLKGQPSAKKLLALDEMISIGQPSPDRYTVIYRSGNELKSVAYSVPDFKVLSSKVLPAAPK